MNRSFTYYLGLFRKHWIQILLIGALTGAGGYFYLKQQEPVFRSTVKLRIIRQHSGSSRDVSFTFEEDQVFYNTQYDLLRTQIDWAGVLLDRVALLIVTRVGEGSAEYALKLGRELPSEEILRLLEKEPDPAVGEPGFEMIDPTDWVKAPESEFEPGRWEDGRNRWRREVDRIREEAFLGRLGLSPDTFLEGITARPISGTHLAELSYRAKDPGTAVLLVNMYAELYRDMSRGERRRSVDDEIGIRQMKLRELGQKLGTAEEERKATVDAFNKDYGHLNPDGTVNPYQEQAEAVAVVLNEKEVARIIWQEEAERLREVLLAEGVESPEIHKPKPAQEQDSTEEKDSDVEKEPEFRLRRVDAVRREGSLHEELAENLSILALPAVQASENIRALRARLEQREDDRSRLLERFRPESAEVREAEEYIREARRKLGAEVEATILRFIRTGRDLDEVIGELTRRLRKKQDDAKSLNQVYETVALARAKVADLAAQKASMEKETAALSELSKRGTDEDRGSDAIQNIKIERRARVQDTPMVHPKPILIIAFTVLSALLLSFGSVVLVEYFDDTIKTKEDFDRYVGVPDLGFIPRISEREFERRDAAVIEKPRSSVAEAFRSLRTGILFSRRDDEIQCFLVSSAGPGEGKTTVVTNLATIMAEAGRGKVLVIDADLRKARLHQALGIENGPGLTNCLVGSATLSEVVRPTPVENLYVLTSGPTPPNPAELLGGYRMAEILEAARAEYGKVIIDTPPLVAVTDTALLAPLVQGVFLVVSMGKTSWRLIERAKQALAAVGEGITGGIVNDVRSTHKGYGYGYGYTYDRYYGNPEDAEE